MIDPSRLFGWSREEFTSTVYRISSRLFVVFLLLYAIHVSGVFDVNAVVDFRLFSLLVLGSLTLALGTYLLSTQLIQRDGEGTVATLLKRDRREE